MAFWNRKKESDPATPVPESRPKLYDRFKKAVSATRRTLVGRIDDIVRGKREIDAAVLDELEEALIGADLGVRIASEILEKARLEVGRKSLNDAAELRSFIRAQLLEILKTPGVRPSGAGRGPIAGPFVIMIVGVNGVGKTTTIGKLACRLTAEGSNVLICGADTFRAAANDQLAIWANRAGVDLIRQKPGTDPAAVIFDSLRAAKARESSVVIIDTAGRLHTRTNLMAELQKMRRIAQREVEGAPHEVLLIIDAVTGQNGLEQARQFMKAVEVTGLILTKLDGTAKGGIVVAIARELGLPIRYVGIGEGLEDLVEFSPEVFVESIFED
ncbi:MAG: signal recognition particle-docking protein FtsY [Acidobacteria bacterium]|nr:signal recognition particle-docking protein FtsY [Acidobacteriota bacterium]